MKALALAVTLSLTLAIGAIAQDSKPSPKSNGASRQPAEAAANIDVAAIQKKIDEFSEAIKREPKNDAYYGARGQGYQRIGKLDLAIADLTRAIELNPSRQAYFQIRARTFGQQKRYRECYQDYSKAITCGPKTHNLVLKQGQAAVLVGDFQSALRSAKDADALKADDFQTLVLLGSVEQKLGMLEDSLRHLTRASELNPTDGRVISMRADTYSLLGRKDLARNDEERARKLGFQH